MMRRALLQLIASGFLTKRGDQLVPPVNAPPAGSMVPGIQPGTTSAVVTANQVVVFGPNGRILIYNGKPAAGNLIASIAGADGIDSFRNPYYAGFTTYTGNGQLDHFAANTETGINWGTNQNASGGTGHLKFGAPTGIQCDTLTTWDPVAGFPTVETWHTLAWTGAGVFTGTSQYQLTSDGEVEIRVNGSFSVTGTATATLTGPYVPANAYNLPVFGAARFQVTAGTGAIDIASVTAGSTVGFCVRVPRNL